MRTCIAVGEERKIAGEKEAGEKEAGELFL